MNPGRLYIHYIILASANVRYTHSLGKMVLHLYEDLVKKSKH